MTEDEIVLAHEQREREESWLEEMWGLTEEEVSRPPRAASAASALEDQGKTAMVAVKGGTT